MDWKAEGILNSTKLSTRATQLLNQLCGAFGNRQVGSPGNRAATDFAARQLATLGWEVDTPAFECLDWRQEGARLVVDGQEFEVTASPFSPGCQVQAPLVCAATIDELEQVEAEGKVLLLRGELAKEQLMPKNFPFYNPDEHKQITHLVEGSHPAALVCATGRNPSLAAAQYPFPLFEDGDFDIPSVFLTEEVGLQLAALSGKQANVEIKAERRAAQGCNVIARAGDQTGQRVVLTAHIDAKAGTPGALDNAAGVTTLLLLAELLRGCTGSLGVEVVLINGEDYYAAPGEIQYLRMNVATLSQICLNINLDGLGYREGKCAYSFYQCKLQLETHVRQVFSRYGGLVEGEAWYQGDHMVFVQNDVPALAITSELMVPLWQEIAHTEKDVPELVDGAKLVEVAKALREVIDELNTHFAEVKSET